MEKVFSKTASQEKERNWLTKGYYLEVECCMCQQEKVFAGRTKKEVLDNYTDDGWRHLESDLYGLTGYYCGCDYE